MKLPSTVMLLALLLAGPLADQAAAQASTQARQVQDQAATLLSQARRCPDLSKNLVDRFGARATAVVARADGNAARRGPSGDFEMISASLVMAANCKTVTCPGKPPPLGAPNCGAFSPQFKAMRINQDNWQINESLK